MSNATMWVQVYAGTLIPKTTEYEISSDLPGDAIGEIVVDALQSYWAQGINPVINGLQVSILFGLKSGEVA